MPGRLEGKVAVITGAGGRHRTRERPPLCRRGRPDVCVVDLDDETGKEVAGEVDGFYIHADVTDQDDVQGDVQRGLRTLRRRRHPLQ